MRGKSERKEERIREESKEGKEGEKVYRFVERKRKGEWKSRKKRGGV